MACFEATDGAVHLGKKHSVKSFLQSVRIRAPVGPKKKRAEQHHDVAVMIQEAWQYGPNAALGLGFLKEKLIILLMVDCAARPSDLGCIYRILEGRHAMIRFEGNDMRLRYFWPKEVVPGSSRQNSTNTYFSKWVLVRGTQPVETNTVEVMREFLARSSDDEFAHTHIEQLQDSFQPLIYARFSKGQFQKSSVDHISNVMQSALDRCEMGQMMTCHIRGASTSKIVQLVPEALTLALDLGRWTTEEMFRNHYQAPIIGSWPPVPPDIRDNAQQILRWGFTPQPPDRVSVEEFIRDPATWVAQSLPGLGTITAFEDGGYLLANERKDLSHYEFMQRISAARRSNDR